MKRVEEVINKYNGDYNCAQALLTTYASDLGLNEDLAKNLTAAFGAGINGRGEMCGSVSSALLLIGLKFTCIKGSEELKKEFVKFYSDKFITQFIQRNKSVHCNNLLDIDISNPKECDHAREVNLFNEKCPNIIRFSAEVLENIFKQIENELKEFLL